MAQKKQAHKAKAAHNTVATKTHRLTKKQREHNSVVRGTLVISVSILLLAIILIGGVAYQDMLF